MLIEMTGEDPNSNKTPIILLRSHEFIPALKNCQQQEDHLGTSLSVCNSTPYIFEA